VRHRHGAEVSLALKIRNVEYASIWPKTGAIANIEAARHMQASRV